MFRNQATLRLDTEIKVSEKAKKKLGEGGDLQITDEWDKMPFRLLLVTHAGEISDLESLTVKVAPQEGCFVLISRCPFARKCNSEVALS